MIKNNPWDLPGILVAEENCTYAVARHFYYKGNAILAKKIPKLTENLYWVRVSDNLFYLDNGNYRDNYWNSDYDVKRKLKYDLKARVVKGALIIDQLEIKQPVLKFMNKEQFQKEILKDNPPLVIINPKRLLFKNYRWLKGSLLENNFVNLIKDTYLRKDYVPTW